MLAVSEVRRQMQAAPEVRVNVVLSNLGDLSTSGLISLLKSSDGSSNGARVESLEQHLTVGISESVSTYTLKKAANALSTAACETFSGCATEISTLRPTAQHASVDCWRWSERACGLAVAPSGSWPKVAVSNMHFSPQVLGCGIGGVQQGAVRLGAVQQSRAL